MRFVLIPLALIALPAVTEKQTASATMSVTATVVAPPMPPEQVDGVAVTDTYDKNGVLIRRTYTFPMPER
jgi:hypothetical protein